jgi:hypothetical protein
MTLIPAIDYRYIPIREAPALVISNFSNLSKFSKIPLSLPLPNISITTSKSITGEMIFSQFCILCFFFLLLFFFIQRLVLFRYSIRIIIKPKENSDYITAIINYISRLPTINHLVFNGNYYFSYDQNEFVINDDIFARILVKDDNCILDIASNTLNINQLRSFLDKIYLDSVKKDTNQYLYTPRISNHSSLRFEKSVFKTDITFSHFFNKSIKSVIDQVRFFIQNKSWYKKNGFPHTLGVLVYGPSGTGKTSMIKAIAKESGRHIISIKLNKKSTIKQLTTLFFEQNIHVYDEHTKQTKVAIIPFDKRMYLFENIDCLTSKQFSFIKNLLYGVLETPERFIVFTAEDIKSVHSSLLVAGRIDKTIYLDFCDVDTIVDMISNFYETNIENYDAYKISLKDNVLTPSTVYEILFRNITNHENALKEITNLCYLESPENEQINDDLKEEITSMISDELEGEENCLSLSTSLLQDSLPKSISDSFSSDEDVLEEKPKIKEIELVDLKQINKKEVQTDTVKTEVKEVQTNTLETEVKEVQTDTLEKENVDGIIDCEISDSDFSETIEDQNEEGLSQLQFLKGISLIESMSEKIKKNSVVVDDFFTS